MKAKDKTNSASANGYYPDEPPAWMNDQPPALTPDKDSAKWADYTIAIRALGYNVKMNELDDTIELNGHKLNDGQEAELLMKMHDLGFKSAPWVLRSVAATAHNNRYNPIKDFLTSLEWDGKDWIGELARYVTDKHPVIQYEDGSTRTVFAAWIRRWGIGAVGKVLKTGKLRGQNPMLVFAGNQDKGKSTLARTLNPLPDQYHCEETIDPDKEEHKRWLSTKLVWEVPELGATTRKADREGLKNFLTKQDSNFRIPYAKHPVTKAATVSFIGTINPETGFLNDPTGHRRFLVVELQGIDFAYMDAIDTRQLWAQFVALYNAGEPATLSPEEKVIADFIRGDHEIEDPFSGFVLKYYDVDPAQREWTEQTTDIVDQLQINGVHTANVMNVGTTLKRLKLDSGRIRVKADKETKITVYYGIRRNDVGDQVRR